MWFLLILSWLALLVQVLFCVLSIAAGLYYLAELVEEYTVAAGRVIRYLIFIIITIYTGLLLFENLPTSLIICGFISQLSHLAMLKDFPYMNPSSIPFLSSVTLVLVNHYLAFSHFASYPYPFMHVLGFFTVCLWLVPFAFFISLSANENVLPTTMPTSGGANYGSFGYQDPNQEPLLHNNGGTRQEKEDLVSAYFAKYNRKRYSLLTFFNYARDSLLPTRVKKSKF